MKKTALLFCLFFTAGSLYAETTPKEEKEFSFSDIFIYNSPVKKADDGKKFSLNLAGGYTEKKGNTESTATSYSFAVKYDDNITEFKISGFGSYGMLKGIVNDNKGSGVVNFDHYLFWRVEFFYTQCLIITR